MTTGQWVAMIVFALIAIAIKPGRTYRRRKSSGGDWLKTAYNITNRYATNTKTAETQYRDKWTLLNTGEQILYHRLCEALPGYIILSQVSMSQLFDIKGQQAQQQLNEIGKKSVDFLVCRANFTTVTAIELNGPAHNTDKQRKADETKRRALQQAGIPLIVLYPDALPAAKELRIEVAHALIQRKAYEAQRDQRFQR